MDIFIPGAPRHLRVTQTMMEDFLLDPVLAAKVLLGYDLDVFQAARLRYYWWCPDGIDESAISTGKTLVEWIYIQLRCILITMLSGIPHQAAVYYPTLDAGKNQWWRYYEWCTSKIFRAQLGKVEDDLETNKREKKQSQSGGVCKAYYRNEALAIMPAPNLNNDAMNQVSLRLNTAVMGEYTHIDNKSDAIDAQIMARVTGANYNQHHPIWCNHRKLTAHAEPMSHPSAERVVKRWNEIKKGNPYQFYIRYSYKDWSDKRTVTGKTYKEVRRDEAALLQVRLGKTETGWLGQGHGVRKRDAKGFYTDEMLNRCVAVGQELGLQPVTGRATDAWNSDHTHYFLGVDPAQRGKQADGSMIVLRARPKQLRTEPVTGKKKKGVVYGKMLADWDLAFVYGRRLKKKPRVRQIAGWIHEEHQKFGFTKIAVDGGAGGGGGFIKMELAQKRQEINGVEVECRPIATVDDETVHHGDVQMILTMIARDDVELRRKWEGLRGDDNLVHVLHTALQAAFEHQEIALLMPMDHEDFDKAVMTGWSEGQMWAYKILHQLYKQFLNIVVLTDANGYEIQTRNSSPSFSSLGKKDFVSAATFALAAFLIWLQTADEDDETSGDGALFGGSSS
jgi:hypothetical protein